MIDSLFDECNVVADKYGVTLSDVIVQYTRVRLDYERQMTVVPRDVLLHDTRQHFEDKIKCGGVEDVGK